MVSSTRARQGVAAAVIAAAVASIGAAGAQAATVTVAHDAAGDFRGGTTSDTVVREPGAVELARTLEERFDGAPAGWTSNVWMPPGMRSPTVNNDRWLVVDGERADSNVAAGPGSTLEFRAKFETTGSPPAPLEANQHVGFATDFDVQPWAVFTTGSDGALRARVFDGSAVVSSDPIAGVDATIPHDYRIEWSAVGGFAFFVDSNPVTLTATPAAVTSPMRPQGSDLHASAQPVTIDSITLSTHKASGTYTHVLDAGVTGATGLTLTPTSTTPAGTAITYEARTADTPADLSVATFAPLGAGGAVANPKRYVEYRATLTTSNPALTPRLDKLEATFTMADPKPPGSTGSEPGSNPGNSPGGGSTSDLTKPKVLLVGSSARVSKSGVAKLKIRCPRSEKSCAVTVKLKLRGKRVAGKSLTVSSGKTRTFRLQLSSAARRKLAASSSLAATAVVSAEDAAGNQRKTKHKVTLLAPGR